MKLDKKDLNKAGIYCIRNLTNNKVYIGKSINIFARIASHISGLNRKDPNENRHLINAWHKYGDANFEYFVIEYLDKDEKLLSERELYWILAYKATDRKHGYNLRMDSSTKMIVHEETKEKLSQSISGENNPNYGHNWSQEMKEKMSKIKKEQYAQGIVQYVPENTQKGIEIRNAHWKENPELKEQMKQKVKEKNTKYKIYQYDKHTMELVKVWDYLTDIIKENPNYKKHNIYAVCSGEKKSMYGYIWVKVLIDDIVQTGVKASD
jgi:group I intron endonuclease